MPMFSMPTSKYSHSSGVSSTGLRASGLWTAAKEEARQSQERGMTEESVLWKSRVDKAIGASQPPGDDGAGPVQGDAMTLTRESGDTMPPFRTL